MKKLLFSVALLAVVVLLGLGFHQMNHSQHAGQSSHTMQHIHGMKHDVDMIPEQAGQAGFAAIAEIVQILSASPDTDWAKVNVNALRAHLVDMDRLIMGAVVQEMPIDGGMRFTVNGQGEVLRAIQRMVPAHTAELHKMTEYKATANKTDKGVVMEVTGQDDKTMLKIKGLGFFGLMATGSHHQPHHLMMATGQGHGGQH